MDKCDTFPPSHKHKVTRCHKIGRFSLVPSQNGTFFTSAQVGATIALLVETRHWPCSDFVRILTVSLLAWSRPRKTSTLLDEFNQSFQCYLNFFQPIYPIRLNLIQFYAREALHSHSATLWSVHTDPIWAVCDCEWGFIIPSTACKTGADEERDPHMKMVGCVRQVDLRANGVH